jgi:hypothetical protein
MERKLYCAIKKDSPKYIEIFGDTKEIMWVGDFEDCCEYARNAAIKMQRGKGGYKIYDDVPNGIFTVSGEEKQVVRGYSGNPDDDLWIEIQVKPVTINDVYMGRVWK